MTPNILYKSTSHFKPTDICHDRKSDLKQVAWSMFTVKSEYKISSMLKVCETKLVGWIPCQHDS